MSQVAAISKRIDAVLRKYAPLDRTVYKRVVTASGGDALIGRAQTFTNVDTLLDPQPMFERLTRYPVGPQAKGELIVETGGSEVGNSYALYFSVTAISTDELKNPNLLIVFEDSAGDKEVFRVTDYDPTGIQGQDLMYTAYIQSTERP